MTQNEEATKPAPPMINEQMEKELESVRRENEVLRRRLQDLEAATNDRVKEVETEKEREFSDRVDVYVAEIRKERNKCEVLRREMASLKEELTTAKAENEQRRQPRQQAAKKLDKNEKATTHGATASQKTGKKQCGDNSFCALKADKGFRHATRQLFQSRLVQVSDRFLRVNDKPLSEEGRCFDFDDFLTELQGWLSILRAKKHRRRRSARKSQRSQITVIARRYLIRFNASSHISK